MDKEMLEQFQLLAQSIAGIDQRLSGVEQRIEKVEQEVKDSEVRTKILIENKITSRLNVLVDGYKTVHEKQWELEHKTEDLQNQVDDLKIRIAALENKPA